jgi:hypothetical protein
MTMQTIATLAAAARATPAPTTHRTTTSGDAAEVRAAPLLSEQIGCDQWSVWAAMGADLVLVECCPVLTGGSRQVWLLDPEVAEDAIAEAEHLAGLARE